MSNLLWKSLVVSPAVLGATLLVSATAIAAPNASTEVSTTEQPVAVEVAQPEILAQAAPTNNDSKVLDQVNRYSNEGKTNNSLSQVTSVSQFSDVQPTDWAFQALQSLVERYGCIAGYPNGTYRGNRALTRYEFAAGLNACLDRVNELIATATADLVTKQDLATLQRLQEEFSAELATLRGRVDALEARTAELEANQFSTTTKLVGEAIFAVSDVFGGNSGERNNTVFQDRVRLGLQTSFTGRDVLTTRLTASNATPFTLQNNAGTDINSAEPLQTYNVGGTGGNSIVVDRLTYEAPVGPVQVYLAAAGGKHSHYAAVNNPYFFDKTDGGNGALSTFSSENPIYRIGGGAGIAFNIPFGQGGSIIKPSSITVGYLASEADSPTSGEGLFNGNYAALGQLNFGIGDRLAVAATYVHSYNGAGSSLFDNGEQNNIATGVVGTSFANNLPNASSSNSYGLSAAFRPSDKLSISGFISYSDVTGFGAGDDREVWSYGGGIALPDFGKKGNVLGIFGGVQPYSIGRFSVSQGNNDLPFQVEGFYKYRVSDNISITPGVIWLSSPGQNDNNDDAFIGTLRTTFTF
ncbi:iron uptake porin [Nostoc sp. FACHB-87]|uniref:iron uptake porin n=1 Tax=Nostocales TaxID=1161 RepID=UPI0016842809|nr:MULTISPECIES: iron uptake porin [Nostocales]MBD2302609.1 iron uptake porin [Nostoc sp. FACHB-190]MBD2458132.1 iron uptake porin [Nostoc sp. FACHB-87]MBD2478953.1 iron uptake porin [Anabaena sp. FACHB-83]MBD2491841.1 iron uptake porin [Aulosira sp. FACHB-615]